MTMGILEGLTSAAGDELTELSGFRSTRLTANVVAETRIQMGVQNATSLDGVTITFPLGTLLPAVAAGQRFRLLEGPNTNEEDTILAKPDAQTLVLARGIPVGAPVAIPALAPLSWEVFTPGDTTATVESTIDWSDAGELIIESVRYRYDSKTLTSFSGLRAHRHHAKIGYISTIAGLSIADGKLLTLDDGRGVIAVYEFDKDHLSTFPRIPIPIDNAMIADDVRDAIIAAINNTPAIAVTASIAGPATVKLTHDDPGGIGLIHATNDVGAGFLTDGPRGFEVGHTVPAEVIEFTRNFTGTDVTRRSVLLEYATGDDLNTIGRNLGIPRPPALGDDERYRALIKAIAYSPRGTILCMELALDALLGRGNYEIFEDLSITPPQHRCKVYFRRLDDNARTSVGKTILDGEKRRPIASASTVDLLETPIAVRGITLAPEPNGPLIDDTLTPNVDRGLETNGRLIAYGTMASSVDGGKTVTTPGAGQFPATILPGDIFIGLGDRVLGKRGVIKSRDSATQLTLVSLDGAFGHSPLQGSPLIELGLDFVDARWKIVREVSNFRWYKPSAETIIDYVGDPGTVPWTFLGTALEELANVGVFSTDATYGPHLKLIDPAPAATTTAYKHVLRVQPESEASFEFTFNIDGATISAVPGTGLQASFHLRDGERSLSVGVIKDGSGLFGVVGFINAAGSFLSAAPGGIVDFLDFASFTIRKHGRRAVELLQDGRVVDIADYAAFAASGATELVFGCLSTVSSDTVLRVKQVDWSSRTVKDFWNLHRSGSLPGPGPTSRDLVDGGAPFLLTDVGKRLRISNFTVSGRHNPLGEWIIEAVDPGLAQVTLNGPTQRGARTQGAFVDRITIRGDVPFSWPDHVGHKIVLESGPNAGAYTIVDVLDPVTLTSVEAKYPNQVADYIAAVPRINTAEEIPVREYSNVVRVSPSLLDPSDDTIVNWHLEPTFDLDAGPVPYEIVDAGTVAGTVLSLRAGTTFPIAAPLTVAVSYTTVQSAYVIEGIDVNSETAPGVFTEYPFYLFDNFGFIRDVAKLILPAGVFADFDNLFRDAAGVHILEPGV